MEDCIDSETVEEMRCCSNSIVAKRSLERRPILLWQEQLCNFQLRANIASSRSRLCFSRGQVSTYRNSCSTTLDTRYEFDETPTDDTYCFRFTQIYSFPTVRL